MRADSAGEKLERFCASGARPMTMTSDDLRPCRAHSQVTLRAPALPAQAPPTDSERVYLDSWRSTSCSWTASLLASASGIATCFRCCYLARTGLVPMKTRSYWVAGLASLLARRSSCRLTGKLTGMAVRHGLSLVLHLSALVWRPLARLETVDTLAGTR
jgi:hypothetical protein